jgi:hypothetical protein
MKIFEKENLMNLNNKEKEILKLLKAQKLALYWLVALILLSKDAGSN